MLEYKERTLAGHGASPVAERRPVPVDLRHDWPQALRDNGFDAARPTAWLAEGLLPFLPPAAQEAMFAAMDTLSASGSRVAVEMFGVGEDKRQEAREKWNRLRANCAARGEDTSFNPFELWFDNEGRPEPADWFTAQGWAVQTVSARDEAIPAGSRPEILVVFIGAVFRLVVRLGDPPGGNLVANRGQLEGRNQRLGELVADERVGAGGLGGTCQCDHYRGRPDTGRNVPGVVRAPGYYNRSAVTKSE